jgi:hypothetical protein
MPDQPSSLAQNSAGGGGGHVKMPVVAVALSNCAHGDALRTHSPKMRSGDLLSHCADETMKE